MKQTKTKLPASFSISAIILAERNLPLGLSSPKERIDEAVRNTVDIILSQPLFLNCFTNIFCIFLQL